jgi:Ca2+/Na+ antiporter
MKNNLKLILANLFALLAVVFTLLGSKLVGLDLANSSGATKAMLFLLPQLGFIYFYLKSTREENKKVMA